MGLSQDQANFTKLQADFTQAQREIEAKDKQIVTLLRRANGGSEVKGFCMFSDSHCLAICLLGDRGAEDYCFYSLSFLLVSVVYAKIRVKRSPSRILSNVMTTGGCEYWKQVEKQLREQLAAEQKSSAGLVRKTTNANSYLAHAFVRQCACLIPGLTSV